MGFLKIAYLEIVTPTIWWIDCFLLFSGWFLEQNQKKKEEAKELSFFSIVWKLNVWHCLYVFFSCFGCYSNETWWSHLIWVNGCRQLQQWVDWYMVNARFMADWSYTWFYFIHGDRWSKWSFAGHVLCALLVDVVSWGGRRRRPWRFGRWFQRVLFLMSLAFATWLLSFVYCVFISKGSKTTNRHIDHCLTCWILAIKPKRLRF